MINVAAHTMATPGLGLSAALTLFAELGFDGVELIYAEDYPCAISSSTTSLEITRLRRELTDLGLALPNLVPYVRALDHRDRQVRRRAIEDMRQVLDIASDLGSTSVRVWAGNDPDPNHHREQHALLVDSLQQLASTAEARGVLLRVENHMGSHAISGAATARIVADVGSPQVGILYDPANLLILGDDDVEAAFAVQQPWIGHVHFKDVSVLGEARHLPRVAGTGDVPWQQIFGLLVGAGYEGFITTEFEKRWHPSDLPPSRDGLSHELATVRRHLADIHSGKLASS